MDNPQIYVISPKDSMDPEDWEVGSNLLWCKEKTQSSTRAQRKAHVLYKLVPIYGVDIKIVEEFHAFHPGGEDKQP